jgi:tetratricopeptide (TPR) repeat protein
MESMKSTPLLCALVLLLACVGCKSEQNAGESSETPSESSQQSQSETSDESTDKSADKRAREPASDESTDEAPQGEQSADEDIAAEPPNPEPLKSELNAMQAEADTTLMEDPACEGFSDLQKCQRHETAHDWEKAAQCFAKFVVVGGPDQCRAAQLVKAAAYYDKADNQKAAAEARLEVVELTEEPSAATVDAADYLVSTGEVERARELYSSWKKANPEGALTNYVDEQCARIDGCQ